MSRDGGICDSSRTWKILLLVLVAISSFMPSPSLSQDTLDEIAKRALAKPTAPARKVESLRFGTRGTTLYEFALSKSDKDVIYLSSKLGFVFGTNDGGVSWKEGRLITRRSAFFGSIRPSVPPGGAPFSSAGTIGGLQRRGFLKSSLVDSFSFPFSTTSYQVLDFDPQDPAYWSGLKPGFFPQVGARKVRDRSGGGGGGDAARLGVGLKMSAKRLGGLLRKKGKKPAGMNLQLLLTMRGSEPTAIRKLAVHPTKPNLAFAATDMGLYRTTDGGYSWLNAYPGRNLKERRCLFVIYDPVNANKIYVGTGQGLLFSEDGGQKFQRVSGTQLSSVRTTWLEFHPSNPDIIYAGTNVGAFRTVDGGKNWKWIFYETLKRANYITSIALDPNDPNRVTLGTYDGLFRSADGGKNWGRSGALLFTSVAVDRVLSDPLDSNHVFAMTYYRLWESFDWGETWQSLYLDDGEFSPRSIRFDPRDPTVLWMLTSNELMKISPFKGGTSELEIEPIIRRIAGREPRMSDTHDAVLKHFYVHQGQRTAQRKKANIRWLLPKLNVFAGVMDSLDSAKLEPTYLGNLTFQGQKHVLNRGIFQDQPYAGMMLVWKLDDLIFDMEELTFGRVFNTAAREYHHLKFETDRLYEERKRLIMKILSDPPEKRFDCKALLLRLEELTAHLNMMSGGIYDDAMKRLDEGTFWGPEAEGQRCLDYDDDNDGILDDWDHCPLRPEDFDGVSDEDGCPED